MKMPLARGIWLETRTKGAFGWLRGVDLNHRPLGYEGYNQRIFNELDSAVGISQER